LTQTCHIFASHVTCRIETDMSHICITRDMPNWHRHVTYLHHTWHATLTQTCHIYASHVTCRIETDMSHICITRDMPHWNRHVTYLHHTWHAALTQTHHIHESRVTCLIDMCDIVTHLLHVYMRCDSFTYDEWIIHACHIWHDTHTHTHTHTYTHTHTHMTHSICTSGSIFFFMLQPVAFRVSFLESQISIENLVL